MSVKKRGAALGCNTTLKRLRADIGPSRSPMIAVAVALCQPALKAVRVADQ
jgi:hypothetical protein